MSLIAEKFNTKLQRRFDPGISYQLLGGALVPIADNAQNYITKGYSANDLIYSIINLILDKVRMAPWSVYEVVEESSLKAYHAIQSKKDVNAEDLRKARDLQHKAVKPVKNPGKWGDLVRYPNEQDTFQELVANAAGFKMITGNKYIWGDLLDGGANIGFPNSFWLMPPQWVQILATRGYPCKVVGYEMNSWGWEGKKKFGKEEVLHEKYYDFDHTINGSQLVGMSPFKAGLRLTNRDNSALDTSTSKFQNGGMDAIIYLDEDGIAQSDRKAGSEHMKAVKQSLVNEYTGPDNWGKIATSGWRVGVAKLGLTPVELAIIEAEKWDLRRFCNLLGGVPSQLMNDPENKTYNNQREGEKALTSRCGLAHLTSTRESFNRKGHEDWKLDKRYIIDFDMTVYSELQPDMSEMVKWLEPLAKITGMSPNRILDLMGLEKMNDKIFDEPWIRTDTMGEPLSEWQMNQVDKTLNDGE